MKAWIVQHGRALGWIALSAVIAAVAVPAIGQIITIQSMIGGTSIAPLGPTRVALAVSAILAVVGLATGIAVWVARAPGYSLGKAAVVVLGVIFLMVGSTLMVGYLMSLSHP